MFPTPCTMSSTRTLDFRRVKLIETVDNVDKDLNIADISSSIRSENQMLGNEKVPFGKKHDLTSTEPSVLDMINLPKPDMARRREELDKIFRQIELRKHKRLRCKRKTPRIPKSDEPWSTTESSLSELYGVKYIEPLAVSPSLSFLLPLSCIDK